MSYLVKEGFSQTIKLPVPQAYAMLTIAKINPTNKKSYGELYKDTIKKINKLRQADYKVIYVWEKDFKEGKLISEGSDPL